MEFFWNFRGWHKPMAKILLPIFLLIIVTSVGPLWLYFTKQINLHEDYRTANRQSCHLAPSPKTTKDAIVQIYSARAFNWRGLFAVHTWIAYKAEGASTYH